MRRAFLAALLLMAHTAAAQTTAPATLPAKLPDPLVFADGTPVARAEQWPARRAEIRGLLAREMYGRSPEGVRATATVLDVTPGLSIGEVRGVTQKQFRVHLTGDPAGPSIDLLVYLPPGPGPHATLLALNFFGNHTLTADEGVRVPVAYTEPGLGRYITLRGVVDNRPSPESRGQDAGRWAIEPLLTRGYAFATAWRNEIDPDLADLAKLPAWAPKPVRLCFKDLAAPPEEMTAMGAWAFALSRCMDVLETDREVDRARVAVFGWSRLGKAALWAAANDERFAMLISAESGSGGAKLMHHTAGERVKRLVTNFPHWFATNYRSYTDREAEMPFDAHFAISLLAPRPAYFSASQGDAVFDPVGEFLGPKAAEPVYALLGHPSTLPPEPPPLDTPTPTTSRLAYHRRTGPHDVTPFDWQQYLAFMDHWLPPHQPPHQAPRRPPH